MSTWVFLAFTAGLLQSARNGLSRSLVGNVSPILNSWARFAFNLPFSTALISGLVLVKGALGTSLLYFTFCLGTGVTQLLGNVFLIAAFRHQSFAHSIVLHKLEILFTALIGVSLFAEYPTPLGWAGIVLCVFGVVLMHGGFGGLRVSFGKGSWLAIAAGLMLVFASFLLKEANEVLVALNSRVGEGRFEVAAHTLFHVTWMETLILTAWLRHRRPGELSLVPGHARRMSLVGVTGFLGSLCWFWAYSLTLVAYVKAVGQVETIAAVLYSLFIWRERQVVKQLPGILFVVTGILLVLVGGARG